MNLTEISCGSKNATCHANGISPIMALSVVSCEAKAIITVAIGMKNMPMPKNAPSAAKAIWLRSESTGGIRGDFGSEIEDCIMAKLFGSDSVAHENIKALFLMRNRFKQTNFRAGWGLF